jgi:hypothetical protein
MYSRSSNDYQKETKVKAKDKEEIEQKWRDYQGYMDWKEQGILHDLQKIYNILNPTIQLLLPIALNMSALINVPIGRQEKRRRNFLIGWLNKNYDEISKYIPRMVIRDEKGEMKGPNIVTWQRYAQENPDAEIFQYINQD